MTLYISICIYLIHVARDIEVSTAKPQDYRATDQQMLMVRFHVFSTFIYYLCVYISDA